MEEMVLLERNVIEDRREYLITLNNNHAIETTVTANNNVVDKWLFEVICSYDNNEPKQKVGIGMQYKVKRGSRPSPENPPVTLQVCANNRCLIYQISHSNKFSKMLVVFINTIKDRFTFVSLLNPQDIEQKFELLRPVHLLKIANENKPIDVRARVARAQEKNGRCPSNRVLARQYLDGYGLNMSSVSSNWATHTLDRSQIVLASVFAYLPVVIAHQQDDEEDDDDQEIFQMD